MDEFRFLFGGRDAQLAEQVDGGGKSELGCTEAGDEVAATDASAFFEGFEDVVDGGEATGKIFGVRGFAEDYAVAGEELLGDGVGPLGLRGGGVAGFGSSRPSNPSKP